MTTLINPFQSLSKNNFPDFDSCWETFESQNAFQHLGQVHINIESPAKWRAPSSHSQLIEEDDDISVFSYITLSGSTSASSSLCEERGLANEDEEKDVPPILIQDYVTHHRGCSSFPTVKDNNTTIELAHENNQAFPAIFPVSGNVEILNLMNNDKRQELENEMRLKLEEAHSHIATVNARTRQWFPSRPDFAGLVSESDHQNCFAYFRPYI